ncbi:MAG: Adenosylcobinamide-phosphate guanylyltransferase [Methanoregula sp. PtaU1.Bin051]|nr:MAG: Adenosylcobinamide-phosphate guanylyltransferase [Methanoregula sp. PtaU1.Bin051]
MLALIMAGGEGSRLDLGEKPLVAVGGKPMVAHVINAFQEYGCHVVVAASPKTPMTQNWCRVNGIDVISTLGEGYVEDMVSAVKDLGEMNPLFVSVSDLPCLLPDIVEKIRIAYRKSGMDACSAWIPLSLARDHRDILYVEIVDGTDACPVGINILRGDRIDEEQTELRILLHEPRLAYNINTRADLSYVNSFFRHSPH